MLAWQNRHVRAAESKTPPQTANQTEKHNKQARTIGAEYVNESGQLCIISNNAFNALLYPLTQVPCVHLSSVPSGCAGRLREWNHRQWIWSNLAICRPG